MIDPVPGRCMMPWHVFASLPAVRSIAPTIADQSSLREQLRRANVMQNNEIDAERAGVVVRQWEIMRRAAAIPPRLQPARRRRQRSGRQRQEGGPMMMWNPLTGERWGPAGGWQ
jgi:hypothetical protein